jgi:hypothetical protein
MANAPQTYAQWAAYGGLDGQARFVLNTLIENDPLLGMLPLSDWPGTNDFKWDLTKTLPTVTNINESSTLEATQALRKSVTTYLSQYGGEVQIPVFVNSTQNAIRSAEAEDVLDLIRASGRKMSAEVIQGNYMTEANVTIQGTGVAATPGIDSVSSVNPAIPVGYGDLQYTHSGTLLQFRAPGSTTFGAAVSCSGNPTALELADGDNTDAKIVVSVTTADFATVSSNTDMFMGGAFTFQRPEEMAGLREWAAVDSDQKVDASGVSGDALTLAKMDEAEELVLGPKSEKVWIMNPRTRRAAKSLIVAAGGMTQGEFQDERASKYGLHYEGIPIIASPGVVTTDSKGSASNLTKAYCVRLNQTNGFHLFTGAQASPNAGTAQAISDHDAEGGPSIVPGVFLRRLYEDESVAAWKWRLTIAISCVLRRSSSCAVINDLTS